MTPLASAIELTPTEFADSVLLPLSFRMFCRKDAGENIAIGQGLRRDMEQALVRAADIIKSLHPVAGEGG